MTKPVVDRLERDLQAKAGVLRLNAWSPLGKQLAARYGVRGVPTFLLFDGEGRMIHTQVGLLDADTIREQINLIGG